MTWRASDGLRAWVFQRVSAVYLAVCLLVFLATLAAHPVFTYASWRALFATPFVSVASAMFVFALAIHAWVGMRDVILDYLHAAGVRFLALTVVATMLLACVLWAMRVLLLVA